MFLATTPIKDFWDFDNKIILLGPWCLSNDDVKRLLNDKDYSIVPSPWKPATKIKDAADYCYGVYKTLLPLLSETLNFIHGVSYPLRYWQILIGPWLLHFIEVLYDRYKRIEKALEISSDFYTYALPREQCNLTSIDMFDFLAGAAAKVNNDYYNLKLFSLAAYELCPQKIIEKDIRVESKVRATPKNCKKNVFHYSNFNLIKTLLTRKLVNLSIKSSVVLSEMYDINLSDMLLLKWKTGFGLISFKDFYSLKKTSCTKVSPNLRERVKLKGYPDKFQSLLYKVLPYAMPMCYMENYKLYRDSIKNFDYVKIIGSATGWYSNERFKFFAAAAAAKKEVSLVDFQHGGGYGTLLTLPVETISCEKDIFYVWGWESQASGDKKLKNLPSPHLSIIKDTYFFKNKQILFISTGFPRYHYRFTTMLQPEDIMLYLNDQIELFGALSEEIRKNIIYRSYPIDYNWGERERLLQRYPDIKLLNKGSLIEYMQNVKFLIIDHPVTSFVQALAINVPSILYWNDGVWLMRPESEKYFAMLRSAGVIYKTPTEAAKKIIDMYDDPLNWWQSEEVQHARSAFLLQYGYSRKDWMDVWTKEISSLVSSERKN